MLQKGKSKKEKKPKKPRAKKAKAKGDGVKAPKGQSIKQSISINLGGKGGVIPPPTYGEYPLANVRYFSEAESFRAAQPVKESNPISNVITLSQAPQGPKKTKEEQEIINEKRRETKAIRDAKVKKGEKLEQRDKMLKQLKTAMDRSAEEPPVDIKFSRPAPNEEQMIFEAYNQPVGDFQEVGSETSSRRSSKSSSSSEEAEPSRIDFTRPPKRRIETLDTASFNPPSQDNATLTGRNYSNADNWTSNGEKYSM